MHPVFHEHVGLFIFFEEKLIPSMVFRIGADRILILHHALRGSMDILICAPGHSAQDRGSETGSLCLPRDMQCQSCDVSQYTQVQTALCQPPRSGRFPQCRRIF